MTERRDSSSSSDWTNFYSSLDETLYETHRQLPPDKRQGFSVDFCAAWSQFLNGVAKSIAFHGGRDQWLAVKPLWIGLKRSLDERIRDLSIPSTREFLYLAAERGTASDLEVIESFRKDPDSGPEIVRLADEAARRIGERQAVQSLVAVLTGDAYGDAKLSAKKMVSLGIATRDGCETRGTLESPARRRLVDEEDLLKIAKLLRSPDPQLRSWIALVCAQWGGEEVINALNQGLQREGDPEVRRRFIRALRNIGGPDAVRTFCELLRRNERIFREAALSALEELGTGGTAIYTEPPSPRRLVSQHSTGAFIESTAMAEISSAAEGCSDETFKRRVYEMVDRVSAFHASRRRLA